MCGRHPEAGLGASVAISIGVEPAVVLIDQQLQDGLRRIRDHRPGMVLIIVLPGQSLPHHLCPEAVGPQPGGQSGGVVRLEEDRAHRASLPFDVMG